MSSGKENSVAAVIDNTCSAVPFFLNICEITEPNVVLELVVLIPYFGKCKLRIWECSTT